MTELRHVGGLGVHPDVAAAIASAARHLADAGYVVEERDPPELIRANEIYTQIMNRFSRPTAEPQQAPVGLLIRRVRALLGWISPSVGRSARRADA